MIQILDAVVGHPFQDFQYRLDAGSIFRVVPVASFQAKMPLLSADFFAFDIMAPVVLNGAGNLHGFSAESRDDMFLNLYAKIGQ